MANLVRRKVVCKSSCVVGNGRKCSGMRADGECSELVQEDRRREK